MPLWVTISVGAAFLQNARSALQKKLYEEGIVRLQQVGTVAGDEA